MSPTLMEPSSGFSKPWIILNSVVLPAPLGPITPTMPLRGSVKERSSMRTLSPNALLRCSTSTTMLPRRGPGGIWISSKSSFRVFSASAAISS